MFVEVLASLELCLVHDLNPRPAPGEKRSEDVGPGK